jgi:protein-S-isoprenylcysteine O-methyltransferase Ste14
MSFDFIRYGLVIYQSIGDKMPFYIKIIIFTVASAGIIWLSKNSLRSIHNHGFYRFFAFEAIVILILYNLDYWFDDPFSIHQLISWGLLSISLTLVIWGAWLLVKAGKPEESRGDPALIGIEKTTELITVGIYRYIRHPMYSSGLFGVWGICFKQYSWANILITVIATVFLILTAKMEEAENIRYFGESYRQYMKKTRMFIPFLF